MSNSDFITFNDNSKWNDLFSTPPPDPTFNSNLDAKGNLKSNFKVAPYKANLPGLESQLAGITSDPTALNKYTDYATSTGNSPWAQLMLQQNQGNTNQALDNASKTTDSGVAQAMSTLGAQGGLRSGAAERIAAGGAKNLLDAKQSAQMAGNQAGLGIMGQDAAGKIQALSQIPGLQATQAQPALQKASLWSQVAAQDSSGQSGVNTTNVNNADAGLNAQNLFNQYIYGQKMAGGAANQTAQATENSGKK